MFTATDFLHLLQAEKKKKEDRKRMGDHFEDQYRVTVERLTSSS